MQNYKILLGPVLASDRQKVFEQILLEPEEAQPLILLGVLDSTPLPEDPGGQQGGEAGEAEQIAEPPSDQGADGQQGGEAGEAEQIAEPSSDQGTDGQQGGEAGEAEQIAEPPLDQGAEAETGKRRKR